MDLAKKQVSIPQGTIKRLRAPLGVLQLYKFQFHKVRLKEIDTITLLHAIMFQFHKVRLKDLRRRPWPLRYHGFNSTRYD